MSQERRRNPRVPCRIPAAGPSGPAVIRDLSATGARIVATAAPRIGSRLPLRLVHEDGRSLHLEGSVRRVHSRDHGAYDIGCSFETDAESSVIAWRMTKALAAGNVHLPFVAPPPQEKRRAHRASGSLGDYFTIGGFAALVIGVTVLLLASVLAVGYFGAR